MRPLPSSRTPLRPALAVALTAALLAGCADVHRGVEAVGRVGPPAAPVAEAEPPPAVAARPDIRTVRPRGAPRAPAADTSAAEPVAPVVAESAVPSPRQIFDFHPAGSTPDSWRQPFVIDTNDGPLAADVRRSAAELKAFNADQKAAAARAAKADGIRTAAIHRPCGEMDVAAARPGCPAPPPAAAPPTP